MSDIGERDGKRAREMEKGPEPAGERESEKERDSAGERETDKARDPVGGRVTSVRREPAAGSETKERREAVERSGTEPMPDVTEAELIRLRWERETPFAVYLYTPFCGTCRYGEKMLDVVRAIEPSANVLKSNVNFLPNVVAEWKIESVPCLVFVEGKRIADKLYTMRSVDYLLERVRSMLLRSDDVR